MCFIGQKYEVSQKDCKHYVSTEIIERLIYTSLKKIETFQYTGYVIWLRKERQVPAKMKKNCTKTVSQLINQITKEQKRFSIALLKLAKEPTIL